MQVKNLIINNKTYKIHIKFFDQYECTCTSQNKYQLFIEKVQFFFPVTSEIIYIFISVLIYGNYE